MKSRVKYWLVPTLAMVIYFTVFRIIFQFYNTDFINEPITFFPTILVYLVGLYYDLSIILLVNIPIVMALVVNSFFNNNVVVNRILKLLAIVSNSILIIISLSDIPYFRFNSRRATAEVFDILGDSSGALPSFMLLYWPFVLIGIVAIYYLWKLIDKYFVLPEKPSTTKLPFVGLVLFVLLVVMLKLGLWSPKVAVFYVPPDYRSVATNTPVTLLYSLAKGQERLERKSYFTPNEIDNYFSVRHHFDHEHKFENRNIILFVLESFSYEFLLEGHPNKAPTPFLDKLMQKSTVFNNAFANGTTSSYGLMSILGGIPPFLDEPYFSSIYGENKILGIGDWLSQQGYTTSFFYGAEDDHYGFRKNMTLLGIDHYYSKEDYGKNDYDGHWGVYDQPFFQYAAKVLKQQPKPIMATLFNISSHGPYMVPKEYKDVLPEGTMSAHQSLAYVDLAIQEFFQSIEQEDWYDNTLFVFIADHWAKRTDLEYKNAVGRYRIPFFIYDPKDEEHKMNSEITQQLDVIPTILDKLSFSGDWMSFGRSALADTDQYRFTYNEYDNVYQIIDSSFVLAYDENKEQALSLYNYVQDHNLTNNMLLQETAKALKMEQYIKAVIQTYNNRLIDNDLYIRASK
ncbi:MAG: LTA synthase family protein [Chitinophagales bacterium]